MGFLSRFFESRQKARQERDAFCSEMMAVCRKSDEEIKNVLKNEFYFIDPELSHNLVEYFNNIESEIKQKNKIIRKSNRFEELSAQTKDSRNIVSEFKKILPAHNERALERLIEVNSKLLSVEGKEFDRQQKECIVKDVHNHLVLSGAGTGKTMTIVGKVVYLIKAEKCDPRKILVLSFTNKTAAELRKRIKSETGRDVHACTFHKLGFDILKSASEFSIRIWNGEQFDFILSSLNEMSKEESYYCKLLHHESELLERSRRAYWTGKKSGKEEWEKSRLIVTEKLETLRSYGERDIANFLLANRIDYVYEARYKVDEKDTIYRPDFFLPDYGIYIEYYGIDREGKVPSYFSSRDGKTPSETYHEGMEWKRNLHMEKGTKLVEAFAYERWEGILLGNLRESLEQLGVKFPEDPESMIDKETLTSTSKLFESLLNRMKSKDMSIDDLRTMIQNEKDNINENELILSLFEPVYEKYQTMLKERGEIDFNDMINLATRHVRNGDFVHIYDNVLIDEYQDISSSRYNLLKEMRSVKDFNLFCVGDDWQSIYGFTGSNLSCLYDFEKYWGVAEESKEETTYRFPKKLIDVSSEFILKNPKQIVKELKAHDKGEFSIVEVREATEEKALKEVLDKVLELPRGSTVFFIGRYNKDRNLLFRDPRIELHGSMVYANDHSEISMQYLTAHNAKGLQADCVVLLNNRDGIAGFPSGMIDPPIINLLNESKEDFPFSEERRAYYVAITRAKKILILMTTDGRVSPFIGEIVNENPELVEKNYKGECPMCGGRLVERSGIYGPFIGCSNFPSNGCKYKEKIRNKNN